MEEDAIARKWASESFFAFSHARTPTAGNVYSVPQCHPTLIGSGRYSPASSPWWCSQPRGKKMPRTRWRSRGLWRDIKLRYIQAPLEQWCWRGGLGRVWWRWREGVAMLGRVATWRLGGRPSDRRVATMQSSGEGCWPLEIRGPGGWLLQKYVDQKRAG